MELPNVRRNISVVVVKHDQISPLLIIHNLTSIFPQVGNMTFAGSIHVFFLTNSYEFRNSNIQSVTQKAISRINTQILKPVFKCSNPQSLSFVNI